MKRLEVWQKEASTLGVDLDSALCNALEKLSVSCQKNVITKNKEIIKLKEKRQLLLDCQYDREAEEINELIKAKSEVLAGLKSLQRGSQKTHNSIVRCLELCQDRLKQVCSDLNVYDHLQRKGK